MKPAAAAEEIVLMLIVAALRDRKLIVLWGIEMMTRLMREHGECSAHHGGRINVVGCGEVDEKSRLLPRCIVWPPFIHTRTTTFSTTLRQRQSSISILTQFAFSE